jgi:hypothetical protein
VQVRLDRLTARLRRLQRAFPKSCGAFQGHARGNRHARRWHRRLLQPSARGERCGRGATSGEWAAREPANLHFSSPRDRGCASSWRVTRSRCERAPAARAPSPGQRSTLVVTVRAVRRMRSDASAVRQAGRRLSRWSGASRRSPRGSRPRTSNCDPPRARPGENAVREAAATRRRSRPGHLGRSRDPGRGPSRTATGRPRPAAADRRRTCRRTPGPSPRARPAPPRAALRLRSRARA